MKKGNHMANPRSGQSKQPDQERGLRGTLPPAKAVVSVLVLALLCVVPSVHAQDEGPYAWMNVAGASSIPVLTLHETLRPPHGFKRIKLEEDGYAAWLRRLPVRTDRHSVLAYDGTTLDRPSAAVIAMDVGKRDLMQGAGTIIRLHAEYLWSQGKVDKAAYHFTNGDLSSWEQWTVGARAGVKESFFSRNKGKPREDTHASYRRWLDIVFTSAGTLSLGRDSSAVPAGEPLKIGDFFLSPGSPGHAVIVLDLARHADGRTVALIGQGFTPAEEAHVLTTSTEGAALDKVWFLVPKAAGDLLRVPSWEPFRRDTARRFR